MLTNFQITRILREVDLLLQQRFNVEDIRAVEVNKRDYSRAEFPEFKRDLQEAASKMRLLFLEYQLDDISFRSLIRKRESNILCFREEGDELVPVLLVHERKHLKITAITSEQNVPVKSVDQPWLRNEKGEIIAFVILSYKGLVSDFESDDQTKLHPVRRLLRLLNTERNNILYLLLYAVIIGVISLILPLGIQTIVELISGGVFFSSVYVLIGIVIIGVLISGVLQIVQISLVEYLQQGIFTKAALEFTFRIPRLRTEAVMGNYMPELVNRFFDVINIQKGLPKVLIDLSAGVIQIFFGLLLLSLYHPFFVFFSIALIIFLGMIFYFTGPRGLDTSIQESKHKYKVVQWLEELARALTSFKLAGNTDLPVQKTDYNVSNYLKYRKSHFTILVTQFSFILLFKVLVTGGMLIMGTILVVEREITLGQFVASEVVIILIINAVEKIISYMDEIYDLLTAVDKVAQVTDLPLERTGGIDLPANELTSFEVDIRDLKYRYPNGNKYVLNGISLYIKPGEHVCICGPGGSGKSTLTNVLSGLYTDYEGIITINKFSLRDLDITHLRNKVGKNISQEDIFDGTILDNITVGKPTESMKDVIEAIRLADLEDDVNRLPEGLNTHVLSGGLGLSNTMMHKLILARCLAKRPALLILNDFFTGLKKSAKLDLVSCVANKEQPWTLVVVSNDPLVMAACDRVVIVRDGLIEAEGTFEELMKSETLKNYID